MAIIRTNRIVAGSVNWDWMTLPPTWPPAESGVRTHTNTGPRMTQEYVYTCPPGVRVIVRHIDVGMVVSTPDGDTAITGIWVFVSVAGGEWTMLLNDVFTGNKLSRHWTGTCVLGEGDIIDIETGGPNLTYQISGAILPLQ